MQKLTAQDPETKSPDLAAENLAKLRALFPELLTEGKDGVAVNLDVLKALVGDKTVTDADEKYGLNWHGKRRARQLALAPSTGTLRPCPEDSVDWDTTQNMMIEGDNLEVLKLLQKSYAGKVKLIYIDPPYNTGKDFVYPDNFRDNISNYLELTGQVEGGRKISSNTEASGRFHTDWLNMMYPRLKLARNLLREDGAIFVSIDDHELENLRRLCNEVFGEENFAASIIWQKKYAVSADDPGVGVMHDYLLVFRKSEGFQRGLLPRTGKQLDRYTNLDNDPRGAWSSDNYVSNKSKSERPTLWYPLIHPKTGDEVWPDEHAVWRYSQERHQTMVSENRLYWGPDFSYKKPRMKRFLGEIQDGIVPSTWWPFTEVGHNDEASKETGELLGRKVFDTPKPIRFLSRIITIGTDKNDIVLDFFSGSGASGQAVLEKNVKDGGSRRFILVQLPEPTEQKDYPTIAEITKERLRRAGKKIREELLTTKSTKSTKKGKGGEETLFSQVEAEISDPVSCGSCFSWTKENLPDLGFRVFKLASSNIREWDPNRENLAESLEASIEHLKTDRSEQDILFELLLKLGLDLCVPIETRIFHHETHEIHEKEKKQGAETPASPSSETFRVFRVFRGSTSEVPSGSHTVHSIGGGSLLVCLSTKIPQSEVEPLALGIVKWHQSLKPAGDSTVIFRDSAFADDVAKSNLTAILHQHGLETVRSL